VKSLGPGIELFILLMLFYIFVGAAIVAGIAYLMTVAFKVKIKSKELVLIVAMFFLFFSFSSLLLRGKEEGVTVGFFGDPTRYEGKHLFYGLPEIWARKFEPYDVTARSLFLFPDNIYFIGFFVDFTFWLAFSLILIYSVKIFSLKRMKARDLAELS